MTTTKETDEGFKRFLTSLPYAALLYVLAVEETGYGPGPFNRAALARNEIKARKDGDAYQCPHFNPRYGDWESEGLAKP